MLLTGAGARRRAGRPDSEVALPGGFSTLRIAALAAAVLLAATAVLAASGCSRRPRLHRVTIRLFRFEPATLTVAPGDTIQWDNQDILPHTATSGQAWDSGSIAPGGSWRWVAAGRDSLGYLCLLHPNMKAVLVIR